MAANFNCAICKKNVPLDNITNHITETHSNPEPRERTVGDETSQLTDAEYVRKMAYTVESGGEEVTSSTAVPRRSLLEEVGVKRGDIPTVEISVESGGACTVAETKRVFAAVDHFAGFKVDKAAFVVNFVHWGIINSFSEELSEAGGFDLIETVTSGGKRKFAKASTLQMAINDILEESDTNRNFTFRRLGRAFASEIPALMEANATLGNLYSEGTPMSRRLGIPARHVLVCTSIFSDIKPFNKWSSDEYDAYIAHNRSVTKVSASTSGARAPQDLRISPSEASTVIEERDSDFMHRTYGRGSVMMDKMLAAQRRKGDYSGLGTNGRSV